MRRSAEQNRLMAQGRARDLISTTYTSLENILPKYLGRLQKIPYPFKLRVRVVFDSRSTKKPQGKPYQSYLSDSLSGKECPLSSKYVDQNIFLVNVERGFSRDNGSLEEFLYFVKRPKSFQFSDAYAIVAVDENGEPIPKTSLLYGDSEHISYLPKVPGAIIFPSPKEPYKGRSTILSELTYYSGNEKEIIKKLLLQIVDEKLNIGIEQLLTDGCRGRLIAYEKLLPPGREIRQHLRINVDGNYEIAEYYPGIFDEMIINNDAFAFYPTVKQNVKYKGKNLELQTRLVVEVDPHLSSLEYAGKVFDTLTESMIRLGIPITRFHSGSNSARCESDIDVEDVLNATTYLLDNYTFIGSTGKKKLYENILIDYKTVLNALKKIIFLKTWNYLKQKYNDSPKITMNRFNHERGYVLVDFPSYVSICRGSPKKIVRLDDTTRKLLREANQGDSDWDKLADLPFNINLCTPLLDGENAPKTINEILVLCNVSSSSNRAYQELERIKSQTKKKITSSTIETAFRRVFEKQFTSFCVLSEENFRDRYLNIS